MKTHLSNYHILMNQLTTDRDPRLERLLFKICYHSAATLEGVKPANLVMFRNSCAGCFQTDWDEFQAEIEQLLPIKIRVLGRSNKGINILFYDEASLKKILAGQAISRRLVQLGYRDIDDLESVFDQLEQRFLTGCPNEIGIFLGYPLSDVISFSEKKHPCLIKGYWCVYSNEQRARALFQRFDRAKLNLATALAAGISPSRYLMAVRS